MTFMTNIPRRKIYETMLEFEEGIMDLQVLLLNEENFNKYLDKFNNKTIDEIKRTYVEIKALLQMFLENRKYELGEDFEKDLKNLIEDEKKVNEFIENEKNFSKKFKENVLKINKDFLNLNKIENFEKGKELFLILDKFNNFVPKILEIRRDEMK